MAMSQQVTKPVIHPFDHLHRQPVAHDAVAVELGHGHPLRVRQRQEHRPVQIELAHRIAFEHRLARRGEHRHREQVDGRHRRGAVDVHHDPMCQVIDGCGEP